MAILSKLVKFIPGVNSFANEKAKVEADKAVAKYIDFALSSDASRQWREEEFKTETMTDIMSLFEKHIAYFSSVEAKSRAISQLPLRIYMLDKKGQHRGEITDGAIYNIINKPNPDTTYSEFMEALVSYFSLVGNAFVERVGGVIPKALYVLRPDFVEIKTSAKQLVVEYIYKPDGTPVARLTPDEVIHWKTFHPRSELYGLSPLKATLDTAILDFYAIKFQKNFFKQGGMIGQYATTNAALAPVEFKRFKAQIQEEYSGVDRMHKLPVFDQGGKLEAVNTDVKNTMLKEQRDNNRADIMSSSGVPPIMSNLLTETDTYNNAEIQEKTFWTNTIMPLCKRIADKLNAAIFWPLGCEVAFDFTGVKALQDDMLVKGQTAQALIMSGAMTPDEVRKKLFDMEPLPADYKSPLSGMSTVFPVANPVAPPEAGKETDTANNPESQAGVVTPLTLNSAQITSAVDVMQKLKEGILSKVAATELLVAIGIQREQADKIIASMALLKADNSIQNEKDKVQTEAEQAMFDEMKKIFDSMLSTAEGATNG